MSFAISGTTVTKVDSFELPLSVFCSLTFWCEANNFTPGPIFSLLAKRSTSGCNVSNIQGVCGHKSISSSILLPSSSDPPCWGEGAGPLVTHIVHGSNCFIAGYDVIGISGWPTSFQIICLDLFRPRLSACLLVEVIGWKKLNRALWRSNSSLSYSPITNL